MAPFALSQLEIESKTLPLSLAEFLVSIIHESQVVENRPDSDGD